LRQKKWCILNKQYSKEDYYQTIKRIKEHMIKTGEWGKFFPQSLSPYAYNESAAKDFFPLNKEEALQQGFRWSDYQQPMPQVSKTIPTDRLPDTIGETPDDILNFALQPQEGGTPFRIVPQELAFYRKMKLPIPRKSPKMRHKARFALRNPLRLVKRSCDRCAEIILSTIPPDRPEKVYCEQCYRAHLYG
jgi:hypothetical protein